MKLIDLLVRCWVRCITKLKILITAAGLGIRDEGWAPRRHAMCDTVMRFGYARHAGVRVRWCYKCGDYWHDHGDDDDRGGRKPQEDPPGDPPECISPDVREECQLLLERLQGEVELR